MLSHAVAEGPYDELHHLFCTVGAPTLMITRTVKNTKLKVDYDMLLEQNGRAVNFSTKANHTLGMIFTAVRMSSCARSYADAPMMILLR